MIAIRVRYLKTTNFRSARLVASDGRRSITVPYAYGNEDEEKREVAYLFKLRYFPDAPDLDPTPAQFKGDNYYHFKRKMSQQDKLELIDAAMEKYGLLLSTNERTIHQVRQDNLLKMFHKIMGEFV